MDILTNEFIVKFVNILSNIQMFLVLTALPQLKM